MGGFLSGLMDWLPAILSLGGGIGSMFTKQKPQVTTVNQQTTPGPDYYNIMNKISGLEGQYANIPLPPNLSEQTIYDMMQKAGATGATQAAGRGMTAAGPGRTNTAQVLSAESQKDLAAKIAQYNTELGLNRARVQGGFLGQRGNLLSSALGSAPQQKLTTTTAPVQKPGAFDLLLKAGSALGDAYGAMPGKKKSQQQYDYAPSGWGAPWS